MKCGSSLAVIRYKKGLLQKDVAKAAKITRSFYCQIENGLRIPSLDVGKAIADYLGISLDEFFYILKVTQRNIS